MLCSLFVLQMLTFEYLVRLFLPGKNTKRHKTKKRLRDEFDVEAAIGNFGEGKGGYVRLSYAVYNCSKDVSRLRDAVMEILEDQRFG